MLSLPATCVCTLLLLPPLRSDQSQTRFQTRFQTPTPTPTCCPITCPLLCRVVYPSVRPSVRRLSVICLSLPLGPFDLYYLSRSLAASLSDVCDLRPERRVSNLSGGCSLINTVNEADVLNPVHALRRSQSNRLSARPLPPCSCFCSCFHALMQDGGHDGWMLSSQQQ